MVYPSPMRENRLDLKGLKCPLPALKARKALRRLAVGEVVLVECTDPLAAVDIPNLVRETGDVIEESAAENGLLTFRIRKT